MKAKNDGVEYFTTYNEAVRAAKQCMGLIKKDRVHTCAWQENNTETPTLRKWVANDGLVHWCVSIEIGPLHLLEVLVQIWGEDQMHYNWSVPCDGTPEEVTNGCLFARQVDVDDGEIWSWMWQISNKEMGRLALMLAEITQPYT